MGNRGLIALLAAVAAIALGAATVAAKGKGRSDRGTIHAAVTHTSGGIEYAAGDFTDTVFGKGAITYTIMVSAGTTPGTAKTTGGVTVFTKIGSFVGKTSATATISSSGSVTFTNGTVKLTKGYGGEKGHSFTGTFTGTGASVSGPFTFTFKGTYR